MHQPHLDAHSVERPSTDVGPCDTPDDTPMRLSTLRGLPVFLVLAAALAGCASPEADDSTELESPITARCVAPTDVTPGRPQVYFAPFDGPEDQALCMLDTARSEVVIAHYNIRRERVIAKLIELKKRGVDVRIAVDKTNAAQSYNVGDDALEAAGIKLVRVSPPGSASIMHLKATVIDGKTTMTGSFNWNETAALANDENMLVFRDPEIAARYRSQILEVLGEKPRTVEGGVVLPGVELHFSPEEKLDLTIVKAIDAAKKSVDIAMFTYTMPAIIDATERAARRGVKVRLIVERKQAGLSKGDERVAAAGGIVVLAANKVGQFSAMHQKYAVLDGAKVITGATNWTQNGTRQSDEDLLLLDSVELSRKYRRNFADLLHYYGNLDTTADDAAVLSRTASPVLFHVVNDATALGDQVFVVGSDPGIGSWEPSRAVMAETATDLFPNWAAATQLTAGARVEYKFIVRRGDGSIAWEPGPNRVVNVPSTGRALVLEGTAGDTSKNWTPSTQR